jgi:hypothetical protein
MEITEAYAIAAGGVFIILISINFRTHAARFWGIAALLISKYLTYPRLLARHQFAGPWTPASVVSQLIYVAINIFCVFFKFSSIWMAGLRAANLSLVNLIPLFAGPHLSFLADLLGIPLRTYRQLHRSAGLVSFALLVFHAFTVVAMKRSFSLHIPENLFGLIVSS